MDNAIYENYRGELKVVKVRLARGEMDWLKASRLVAKLRRDWNNPNRQRDSNEHEAEIEALFRAVSQTIADRREESRIPRYARYNHRRLTQNDIGWSEEE